jgi:hypothetical protein
MNSTNLVKCELYLFYRNYLQIQKMYHVISQEFGLSNFFAWEVWIVSLVDQSRMLM